MFKTLVALAVAMLADAGKCPDLLPYRSPRVVAGFDPALLDGLWFEAAYIDLAQVDATCQTLNSTLNPATMAVTMAFRVKYGAVPFTILELYTPHQNESGVYVKTAEMPGGKLLQLATVFVDVTTSTAGGLYDTMTIYSCVSELGVVVEELIFATRVPATPAQVLVDMEAVARKQGVVWDAANLNIVNRSATSKCDV